MANENRVFTNFQSGSLGADHTDSVTTLTFGVAPGFATLAADEQRLIILDPLATAGAPEIVKVTAYTAAATTATIVRGYDGTTARAHLTGVVWAHGPVVSDFPNEGAAFPASPRTYQRFFRTDRGIWYFYDGTRWLSIQLHAHAFPGVDGASVDTNTYAAVPYDGTYGIWLERLDATQFRSATGEWDIVLLWANAANSQTVLLTLDGSGVVTTTWTHLSGTPGTQLLDGTARMLRLQYDEISGSSSLIGGATLFYRLIG